MKIKITAMCNVKGRPAMLGDVVETDERTANYLISIEKAEKVKPVASTGAVEKEPHGHRKTATPAEDLR